MWRDYFPNAEIIGIDINPACQQFNGDKIKIHTGDQANESFLLEVAQEHGPFDIIIDDGGHVMHQQITSCTTLFPYVTIGGTYVIEDLHTSYWPRYEGGLRRQGTTVEFLKQLIDSVNFKMHEEANETFDRQLLSMHFYEGMVFLVKGFCEEFRFICNRKSCKHL